MIGTILFILGITGGLIGFYLDLKYMFENWR